MGQLLLLTLAIRISWRVGGGGGHEDKDEKRIHRLGLRGLGKHDPC